MAVPLSLSVSDVPKSVPVRISFCLLLQVCEEARSAVSQALVRGKCGLTVETSQGSLDVTSRLYKPDVFTLCDQERLFETGPRGGRRPIPKCPYQLLPGAVELKIVEKSLALAGAMAVEPWARQTAAEDDEVREERGAVLGKERGTKDVPVEL